MACTLCNNSICISGSVRPNVATFDCGCNFHLSCVLDLCVNKFSAQCPSCNVIPNVANFGNDRLTAIESLVEARRSNRKEVSGWTSWFSSKSSLTNLISAGTSLQTLRIQGYLPEDFIEKQISWKKLTKIYKIPSLLEFGFKWHHIVVMGFTPENFKQLDWNQMFSTLGIRSTEMLQTSMTIQQLIDLQIPIHRLRELQFSWHDLVKIGGNVKTLKGVTDSMADLLTYFKPTPQQMHDSGFTKENIEKFGWKAIETVPTRKKREFLVPSSKKLFF